MVQGRAEQTATLMSNGDVLVLGGIFSGGFSRSGERYNPIRGTWSKIANLPMGIFGHTATLLPNGRVLVAGGSTHRGTLPQAAELFDPPSGAWSFTGNLNTAHSGHTATLLPNGKVLVVGGYDANISDETTSAELYDSVTGTWAVTGSMKQKRSNHTATLLPNGKVLVAGGYDFVNFQREQIARVELYDPITGKWSTTGSLNDRRELHGATLLPDGKVLVVGGSNNLELSLASAELYDPASGTWALTGK